MKRARKKQSAGRTAGSERGWAAGVHRACAEENLRNWSQSEGTEANAKTRVLALADKEVCWKTRCAVGRGRSSVEWSGCVGVSLEKQRFCLAGMRSSPLPTTSSRRLTALGKGSVDEICVEYVVDCGRRRGGRRQRSWTVRCRGRCPKEALDRRGEYKFLSAWSAKCRKNGMQI